MVKYKATTYMETIERVDVLRETASNVWFKEGRGERREAKMAKDQGYFATWEVARGFLLGEANAKSNLARRSVAAAERAYERIRGMSE